MAVRQREFKLRGGRIILHSRIDYRHGFWQCGLRLGTERKLVRRSTMTTDLTEAKTPEAKQRGYVLETLGLGQAP